MTNPLPDVLPDLIPEKYPQDDLFICDVADAVLKDIMPQMEHPFYSLSKKPDLTVRRYEHNGNYIEITPSVKGLATIYDKDILIYAISQIMSKLEKKEKVSKRVRINTHELLKFTNRGTAGKDYKAICDAVTRLGGVQISTNIKTGDEEHFDVFGLIESSSIRRKRGLDGRLVYCDITLSDWVFSAIRKKEVLTLNRAYFRLRKPIERRIYEIARKHCGHKNTWSVGLSILHKKSGSQGNERLFRQSIKALTKNTLFPDYTVEFDSFSSKVIFKSKERWWESTAQGASKPSIKDTETYELAKKYLPDDRTVYEWEADWLKFWEENGSLPIHNADEAFLGFCKARNKKLLEFSQAKFQNF
ncbi:MAG: replication initiator protein A [Planctomycetes bacterium]|nr:replication initiator protein A [Planctomycetota bacterium]